MRLILLYSVLALPNILYCQSTEIDSITIDSIMASLVKFSNVPCNDSLILANTIDEITVYIGENNLGSFLGNELGVLINTIPLDKGTMLYLLEPEDEVKGVISLYPNGMMLYIYFLYHYLPVSGVRGSTINQTEWEYLEKSKIEIIRIRYCGIEYLFD